MKKRAVRESLKRTPLRWVTNSYGLHKLLAGVLRFRANGRTHRYLCHRYNLAYLNERTVEVPVVRDIVGSGDSQRVLEVGNVLSHYSAIRHDVVDKYERGPGIINEDIVSFSPSRKYDTVVCVSTIEHIGWDEDPAQTFRIYVEGEAAEEVITDPQPSKIMETLRLLRRFVHSSGQVVVTFPVGYNPVLDPMVRRGEVAFSRVLGLRRAGWLNTWVQCEPDEDFWSATYNRKYPYANAVVVGTVAP